MSTFQTITYAVDGAVATITLNRPERRNALTSEMLSELYRAFSQAGGDPAVRDKTKGNLHPNDDRLLEGLLADLRLQYVQLVRATEEKLKAQAAQQFSGADILGKK